MTERPIPTDVLTVLSRCTTEGNILRLPPEQLDRKLYMDVNKVLEALGGKWNRKAKGHTFEEDPAERLEDCLLTGTYTRPADFGFFPSPPAVAAQVAELAELKPEQFVLEPSAGEGALVRACIVQQSTLAFYCYEIQESKFGSLINSGAGVVVIGDFLKQTPQRIVAKALSFKGVEASATRASSSAQARLARLEERKWLFDRVVMNPPFSKGQDVEHVRHALTFLRPYGLLVSVMSAGVTFRQDRRYADFRRECKPEIIPLPEGSFKPSGTNVNAVIVRIRT